MKKKPCKTEISNEARRLAEHLYCTTVFRPQEKWRSQLVLDIQAVIDEATAEKDAEIERLHEALAKAKERLMAVTRCFQRYSSEERARLQSSFRLGYRQRNSVGEYFWISDQYPNIAFCTQKKALAAEAVDYEGVNDETAVL